MRVQFGYVCLGFDAIVIHENMITTCQPYYQLHHLQTATTTTIAAVAMKERFSSSTMYENN